MAVSREQVQELRAKVGVSAFDISRAYAQLDVGQLHYIVTFAHNAGLMPQVCQTLDKKQGAQVYNVAVKAYAQGGTFDSLEQLFRRMEAAHMLQGGSSAPPAPRAPHKPEPRFDPIVTPPSAPAPTPNPSSADMSEYVKRPEARAIAVDVLEQAGDDLCSKAALAARDAAQAIIDGFKASEPVVLHLVTPASAEPLVMGLVHRKTPDIIKALAAGENVYLHGPAGSGKTTVALKAAQAFGVQFYFAAKVESEYLLLGFRDAKGDVVRTPFREAYEHGGMFLFDELDGSSPSAIVALNAALANGMCPFPDGVVARHPDFKCIAAGNTQLRGATGAYTGRAQMDAASIDRFVFIEFDYDEAMEMELASIKPWARYVQSVRQAVKDRSMGDEILITPRATISGCNLLKAGFGAETVKGMTVYKGLDEDTRDQIERAVQFVFTDETLEKATSPFAGIEII